MSRPNVLDCEAEAANNADEIERIRARMTADVANALKTTPGLDLNLERVDESAAMKGHKRSTEGGLKKILADAAAAEAAAMRNR